MCEFQTPFLLYYTSIPTLIVAFGLGFFVISVDRKSSLNRNIFFVILLFWLGTLNSMFQWVIHDVETNLLLSKLSVFEFLTLPFFLFFAYSFVGQELDLKRKMLIMMPFLPSILFFNTEKNSYFINKETCSVGYGFVYPYMYLLATIYIFFSIWKLIKYAKLKKANIKIANQVKIIAFGMVFSVTWILFFVAISAFLMELGYSFAENLLLFIPYGVLVFIGLLTYAITKYQFLNMKLVSAQALTYAIWILIGSQYFFANSAIVYLLITLTLILSIVFGGMLIKSIKQEIKRKEELEKLSTRLAAANEELKKLDTAKSEFISIASHQLRTPLTAIKGFVSLILEGTYGDIDPKVRDALNKVYSSGERLIHLVEDLLNVSRIEAGRMEYKFEKTNIKDILSELCENFILVAKTNNLYLDLKLPKKLSSVNLDRAKIREVISNLIDNALKYTKKGGVTVSVKVIRGNKVELKKLPSTEKGEPIRGNALRITVSDTGIGIPKSEMPYLFKKFSRGKDVGRLNVGGTGLGIYVAKNIIDAHKGRVWAESSGEGKGSKFIIELPIN